MKRAIIILIVLALLGAGAYFLLKKETNHVPVCEPGTRLDFTTRTCVPVGGADEKHQMDFTKAEITLSGDTTKAKLNKQGDTTRYTATFDSGSGSKGSVALDSKDAVPFMDEYVLVPMQSDFGGSGQFTDVALFNAKTDTYVGSVSIGDRIIMGDIVVKDSIAKINFKNRLDTDAMADTPTIPSQMVVRLEDGALKKIMELQNSDYDEVEIKSPSANQTVSGDFVIRGSMPGSWYFEANAQFRIIDDRYQEVAIGSVQALSDWMTTQRVPFEIKLNTGVLNPKGNATIIISSENVQGDEDGERKVKMMKIPVVIK